MKPLGAPFPYYGGKARLADAVWRELGDVTVYAEPFAGSLAVLLASAPHRREIVCDTDGHICNFWRALQHDPKGVARHADYPTFHQDLRARHLWLRRWGQDNAERVASDAEFFDVRAAGWWVWGISSWIGGGWCQAAGDREVVDKRPLASPNGGGKGVQAQRDGLPPDRRPLASPTGGGRGVQAQRRDVPDSIPKVACFVGGQGVQAQRLSMPWDKRPQVDSRALGGRGVQVQRQGSPGAWPGPRETPAPVIGTGERLMEWFDALAQQLARVVVLNRSWESSVTPTLLMDTPTSPSPPVGIFMDPPYLTTGRKKDIYQSDYHGESDGVAAQAYEWAVRHGERYRIAFCCHAGDFPLPAGWRSVDGTFGGIRRADRRAGRADEVMFSPACVGEPAAEQGRFALNEPDPE